jgi:hypothetical protein
MPILDGCPTGLTSVNLPPKAEARTWISVGLGVGCLYVPNVEDLWPAKALELNGLHLAYLHLTSRDICIDCLIDISDSFLYMPINISATSKKYE